MNVKSKVLITCNSTKMPWKIRK